MGPAEFLQHSHRKIAVEDRILARIVMADSGDSAEKILQPSPKQSDVFGNEEMFRYGRFLRSIDVARPVSRVRIWTLPQPWIQIEFQMIVRVDQSRQDQVAFQIQHDGGLCD